jgi:hypothetical protein
VDGDAVATAVSAVAGFFGEVGVGIAGCPMAEPGDKVNTLMKAPIRKKLRRFMIRC